MLKLIFFVCFSFFLLSTSFSQSITGILVNDEPDKNNFRVTDASLHYFSPDSFLATWHDTRANGNFAWAQFFDGHEQEISQVFRIAGNNVIVRNNNNSYSVVDYHYKYLSPFLDPLWVGRLQNYTGTQANGNSLPLRVHLFPPCGTGFVGIGQDLVRTTWGGIHAENFGGYLDWAIQEGINAVAPLSWHEILLGDWQSVQTASHFDLIPTPDHAGAFLIFCGVDIGFGEDDRPGLHFVHIQRSTTELLTARQILADSTITFSGQNDNYISATFLDSNVIHILWARKDSLVEIETDTLGTIQFKQSVPIPTRELPNFQLKDFAVNSFLTSNARKGRSYVLLGCFQYGTIGNESKSEDYFVIYALQNGKLLSEQPRVIPVGQWNTNLTSGDAFLQDNNMLLLEGVEDDNAYLFQLDGEQIVNKIKLSSEAPGDNQSRPLILQETDDSFWITFDESGKRKGRRLDVNGNLYKQVEINPKKGGIFLENGQTFVALGQSIQTSPATLAIQFYNAKNWMFRFEILVSERSSAIQIGKLDENHFFTLTQKASHITQVKVFNSEGAVLDSLSVQSQIPGSDFPIASFPLKDGKFWLRTDRYFLWDPVENSIKEAKLPKYFIGTPISDEQFVLVNSSLNLEELAFNSTYSIIDADGRELIKDHSISDGDHYFSILPLNDDYFLIFYQTNDYKYYFQVFDHSFQSVLKEEPFPKATRNSVGGTAMVVGSHVVFAISDIHNDVTGKDIYASIFDLNDIISKVTNPPLQEQQPLTFELSNPSPNPVKTGQRVSFNLNVFNRHYFEISIYNILGQQVGEIKKRTYSRGEHRIEFKLYDFAAGLYFVRAATENRSMIKKVLVTSK